MKIFLPRFFLAAVGCASLISTGFSEKTNRLADEKSPYLLLHAKNPVDWYPWGEEAFEKARKENKLILLSVGYSTCHWCHVMERESFENEEIAEFLNKNFVSIKLDREERPDVDQVYMTAYQLISGETGGWPLNMFLTPDLKALTGGTYFPPNDRDGRPGFSTVLKKIQTVWTEQADVLKGQADQSHQQMQQHFTEMHALKAEANDLNEKILAEGIDKILPSLDPAWGGLGTEMKFPQVSIFRFLLQSGNPKAVEAILMTCRKMANGGIHDQVGGGFHRYAVDREWLVPHFEKMLYDQAQLIELYLDAWKISGDDFFRKIAMRICDSVLRDFQSPDGGYYCALDAQSEGKEGKFYCWTVEQLKEVLDESEMKLAREVLGVTEKGNFVDHSDPDPLPNLNILFFQKPREALSAENEKAISSLLEKLVKIRSKRIPPPTDDKILASWNGLAIAAMSRAGQMLDEKRFIESARRAHDFVKSKLWDEEKKKLYHRWRDGERDESVQTESYLSFLRGTRALYEAELKENDLELAVQLAEGAKDLFYDQKNGGFYQGEAREDLVLRLKGQFDSAIPTESSIAAREYRILSEITGREDFAKVSELTLRSYLEPMKESPTGMGEMLMSLRFSLSKPARLVIAGEAGRNELLKIAATDFDPDRIIVGTKGPVSDFTSGLKPKDDLATAYYCVGETCQLPVNTPEDFAKLLRRMREASK